MSGRESSSERGRKKRKKKAGRRSDAEPDREQCTTGQQGLQVNKSDFYMAASPCLEGLFFLLSLLESRNAGSRKGGEGPSCFYKKTVFYI